MSGLVVDHLIRADADLECRVCQVGILSGQRAAFVCGLGYVHLKCLLVHQDEPAGPANPDHGEQE